MSWVKLHHRLLKWEWKDDPNMVALWVEILLQANYEESKYHGETFEPGSFPTSIGKLAIDTGLTVSQVRTCLSRLKSTNEIAIDSTSKGTKISVVKWAEYQGQPSDDDKQNDTQNDKPIANPSQTDDKQIATLKEYIEVKNIRNIEDIKLNADRQKPFQKPSLDDIKSYCIERGYTDIEAERFYSYYEKNDWTVKERNGSRRKMKNWKLCLNSWVVNEIRYNQTNDLRNRAREAYIRDIERKEKFDKTKGDGNWFD